MKQILLLSAALLLLTGCLNDSIEQYDDTADLEFYESFLQQEGVQMTDSGLLYRVVEEGEGTTPDEDNFVFVFYQGNSVDESVNFSTGDDPDILLPSTMGNFSGLGEGIQLMNTGAKYEFVIPSDLALRDGRVYFFEVELESYIIDPDQFLTQNAELEDITETDSGLQYRIVEENEEEGESPGEESTVRVNYVGSFTNGYVFDQSGSEPAEFSLGGVIPGFSEGIQLMKEGDKFELFLPASIGYGSNPPQGILPGAVLVFEVELVEVVN
jgi:FKBP-type peptidyl-prolyl cis-trans isomerase